MVPCLLILLYSHFSQILFVDMRLVTKSSYVSDFSTNTHLIKKRSKRFKMQIKRSSYSPFTFPVSGDPHCAQNYLDLLYICDPDVWLGHTDAIRLDKILSTSKFGRCQIQGNNAESNNNNKAESNTSNSEYSSKFADHMDDFSHENSLYSVGLALIDALYFDDLDECRSSFRTTPKNESSVENIDIEDDDEGNYKEERATLSAFLKKTAKIIKRRWNFRKSSSILTDNSPICAKDVFILMVKSFAICMKSQVIVFRKRSASNQKLSPMISVVFAPRVRSVINEATFVKLINGLAISPSANDPLGSLTENFHSAYNTISRMFFILETSLPGINRVKNKKLPTDEDQGQNMVQTIAADHSQMSAVVSNDTDELTRKFRSMKYHVPQWAVVTFVVTGCLSVVCFSIGHFISTGLRSKSRFSNPDRKSLFYKTGHRRWRAGFAGGMVEMRHGGNNPGGQYHQPANPISLGGFPLKLSKSRPLAGGTGGGVRSGGVNIVRHARQKHSRGAGGFGTSKNSYSRV